MATAQDVNNAYLAIESSAACSGKVNGPATGTRRLKALPIVTTLQHPCQGTTAPRLDVALQPPEFFALPNMQLLQLDHKTCFALESRT